MEQNSICPKKSLFGQRATSVIFTCIAAKIAVITRWGSLMTASYQEPSPSQTVQRVITVKISPFLVRHLINAMSLKRLKNAFLENPHRKNPNPLKASSTHSSKINHQGFHPWTLAKGLPFANPFSDSAYHRLFVGNVYSVFIIKNTPEEFWEG